MLADFGKSDGGLAIDGHTGQLLGKVMFKGRNEHVPIGHFPGGTRHRSAFALARTMAEFPGTGGLCMVVSEGGTIGEVKVFLGSSFSIYDDADESWTINAMENNTPEMRVIFFFMHIHARSIHT